MRTKNEINVQCSMFGRDMADPVDPQDAATKTYILMIMSLGMLLAKIMLTQKTLNKILPLTVKQKKTK